MNRLSKEDVRELVRRHRRAQKQGGASLADIRADMLRDMVTELGKMVRKYSGHPRETRKLLKAIVIAETEGVTVEELTVVLGKLRTKLEKTVA